MGIVRKYILIEFNPEDKRKMRTQINNMGI